MTPLQTLLLKLRVEGEFMSTAEIETLINQIIRLEGGVEALSHLCLDLGECDQCSMKSKCWPVKKEDVQ